MNTLFEFLFKYPASAFRRGHFVLLSPWPVWVLLLVAGIAAGILFWHVRRSRGALAAGRAIAIWGLEAALAVLVLFLLWRPAISVSTLKPQQNVIAVLLDDSRSMSISDAPGSREEAAKALLQNSLLKPLSDRFQLRIYRFGKEPQRVQSVAEASGTQPATRIGDSLEHVLAESASLPLGAIVLLSDGAENAGGISMDTVNALRNQRIPVHTIGFGKEHAAHDLEVTDAVVPAHALPKSRVSAQVTLQSYGLSGSKAHLTVTDGNKLLASRDVTLAADGQMQTETLLFDCGDAGPRSLEFAAAPIGGEENQQNNKVTRLMNVTASRPRLLYLEGEPRWDYKFIMRSLDDYPDMEIVGMVRTTQNKLYRQAAPNGLQDPHELEDGFPTTAAGLFRYQGLILGAVEASYFTSTQQQLIRDFVDRRGGGILLLGGRTSLSDGGYQSTPLADLVPTLLPASKGTFHRDFVPVALTTAGAASLITRLDEDPARNAERWKKMPPVASYQVAGEAKPGATTLLETAPAKGQRLPLLVTQNFGRGRSAVLATGGSWRWKMGLDHTDKSHPVFFQQLLRYLVTDTPGQITASTPKTVLSDETRLPVRVEVRDKEYKPVVNAHVQARFLSPGGASATVELQPVPLEEGVYSGEWTAESPGSYVAEIVAGREQEPLGTDVLTFRREDGVAENFRTGQNRDLLEKLAQQTGGRYYRSSEASKLTTEISYSEAGITARETRDLWNMPAIFLLALALRAAEWLLRRRWGVV
jgi:uncharacterized membrane protein